MDAAQDHSKDVTLLSPEYEQETLEIIKKATRVSESLRNHSNMVMRDYQDLCNYQALALPRYEVPTRRAYREWYRRSIPVLDMYTILLPKVRQAAVLLEKHAKFMYALEKSRVSMIKRIDAVTTENADLRRRLDEAERALAEHKDASPPPTD